MAGQEYSFIDASGVVRLRGTFDPPIVTPTPDLAEVLAAGNDAGGAHIINPAPLYAAPNLAAVLAAGHDAGGVHITNPAPLYAAPAVEWETFAASTPAAANGDALAWAKDSGSDLVDLTDPHAPALLASGFYVLILEASLDAGGVPGTYVGLQAGGAFARSNAIPAAAFLNGIFVTVPWQDFAFNGNTLTAHARFDGGGTIALFMRATLAKLS